ncbi:hypothetical protein BLNAU_13355 [Blattamonas nauphoetae]|uniref:Uncharacterized protein n=1 Tax=Blattamonas nauphoetae TaxID=2049346 RepID=A0ABQ9XH05_9EUKA|nr:hypothetical protein BLNAU_13355 [Blattamonas nauphoetae]
MTEPSEVPVTTVIFPTDEPGDNPFLFIQDNTVVLSNFQGHTDHVVTEPGTTEALSFRQVLLPVTQTILAHQSVTIICSNGDVSYKWLTGKTIEPPEQTQKVQSLIQPSKNLSLSTSGKASDYSYSDLFSPRLSSPRSVSPSLRVKGLSQPSPSKSLSTPKQLPRSVSSPRTPKSASLSFFRKEMAFEIEKPRTIASHSESALSYTVETILSSVESSIYPQTLTLSAFHLYNNKLIDLVTEVQCRTRKRSSQIPLPTSSQFTPSEVFGLSEHQISTVDQFHEQIDLIHSHLPNRFALFEAQPTRYRPNLHSTPSPSKSVFECVVLASKLTPDPRSRASPEETRRVFSSLSKTTNLLQTVKDHVDRLGEKAAPNWNGSFVSQVVMNALSNRQHPTILFLPCSMNREATIEEEQRMETLISSVAVWTGKSENGSENADVEVPPEYFAQNTTHPETQRYDDANLEDSCEVNQTDRTESPQRRQNRQSTKRWVELMKEREEDERQRKEEEDRLIEEEERRRKEEKRRVNALFIEKMNEQRRKKAESEKPVEKDEQNETSHHDTEIQPHQVNEDALFDSSNMEEEIKEEEHIIHTEKQVQQDDIADISKDESEQDVDVNVQSDQEQSLDFIPLEQSQTLPPTDTAVLVMESNSDEESQPEKESKPREESQTEEESKPKEESKQEGHQPAEQSESDDTRHIPPVTTQELHSETNHYDKARLEEEERKLRSRTEFEKRLLMLGELPQSEQHDTFEKSMAQMDSNTEQPSSLSNDAHTSERSHTQDPLVAVAQEWTENQEEDEIERIIEKSPMANLNIHPSQFQNRVVFFAHDSPSHQQNDQIPPSSTAHMTPTSTEPRPIVYPPQNMSERRSGDSTFTPFSRRSEDFNHQIGINDEYDHHLGTNDISTDSDEQPNSTEQHPTGKDPKTVKFSENLDESSDIEDVGSCEPPMKSVCENPLPSLPPRQPKHFRVKDEKKKEEKLQKEMEDTEKNIERLNEGIRSLNNGISCERSEIEQIQLLLAAEIEEMNKEESLFNDWLKSEVDETELVENQFSEALERIAIMQKEKDQGIRQAWTKEKDRRDRERQAIETTRGPDKPHHKSTPQPVTTSQTLTLKLSDAKTRLLRERKNIPSQATTFAKLNQKETEMDKRIREAQTRTDFLESQRSRQEGRADELAQRLENGKVFFVSLTQQAEAKHADVEHLQKAYIELAQLSTDLQNTLDEAAATMHEAISELINTHREWKQEQRSTLSLPPELDVTVGEEKTEMDLHVEFFEQIQSQSQASSQRMPFQLFDFLSRRLTNLDNFHRI